ncbi:MAG: hypothetical protein R6V04_14950 [bacterium]
MWHNNKNYFLVLILLFVYVEVGKAQISTDITVTGGWDLYITQADLQGGAGSNLRSTYTSDADQILVEFYSLYLWPGYRTWNWAVDIHKQDGNWHSDLLIDVRRTGDGQCNQTDYSIIGGTSYINITNTDTEFFYGRISGNLGWLGAFTVSDVPIQYRIRGVSATLPAQTYTITIYYTIRDQ